MRDLLYPFAFLYSAILSLRNWCFDRGFLKKSYVGKPVIAVGNMTAGGTGKTPIVHFLAEYYLAKKIKVGIVSRGYKSESERFKKEAEKVVLSQEGTIQKDTTLFGDEPVLLARKLDVPVYVGRKKVNVAKKMLKDTHGLDIVIADDAFQHRYLHRDLNILIIDALAELREYKVIPVGLGRESFAGVKRADIVFVTKSNLVSDDKIKTLENKILKEHSALIDKIFYFSYRINSFSSLSGEEMLTESLLAKKVVLLSTIAKPGSFKKSVQRTLPKLNIEDELVYTDHYSYKNEDVLKICSLAKKTESVILTTEKDAVKLKAWQNLLMEQEVEVIVAELSVEPRSSNEIDSLYRQLDRLVGSFN